MQSNWCMGETQHLAHTRECIAGQADRSHRGQPGPGHLGETHRDEPRYRWVDFRQWPSRDLRWKREVSRWTSERGGLTSQPSGLNKFGVEWPPGSGLSSTDPSAAGAVPLDQGLMEGQVGGIKVQPSARRQAKNFCPQNRPKKPKMC